MRQMFATWLVHPTAEGQEPSQPRSTAQTTVPMPSGSPTHPGSHRSGCCGFREGPSQPDPELHTFLIKKFNIFSTWKQPILQVGRGRVGKEDVSSEGPFIWEYGFGEPPLLLTPTGQKQGRQWGWL